MQDTCKIQRIGDWAKVKTKQTGYGVRLLVLL